jgi:hypothetical protein
MTRRSIDPRRCSLCPPTAHQRVAAARDRTRPAARTERTTGTDRTARRVRARFTPSDLPLLTSSPHRVAALRAISRTLAHLGRGYLGGHAEISCDGAAPRGCRVLTLTECLAAVRAVEDALAGGRGTASVRIPPSNRRPAPHDPG